MTDRGAPGDHNTVFTKTRPTTIRRLQAGDVLFLEGEPSTTIAAILAGGVIVTKTVGEREIELGRIDAGQIVGEMGVIEKRPRNATVRALDETEVEFLDLESFLSRISGDRNLAFQTLLRLCERLHAADDRMVELFRSSQPQRLEQELNEVAQSASDRSSNHKDPQRENRTDDVSLQIFAGSERTELEIPPEGIIVTRFPFSVGRRPHDHEPKPAIEVDLPIADTKPYRLSRIHFTILETPEGFVVSDTTSTLGTRVNEAYVGEHFPSARATLQSGENTIIAGGEHSDFTFRVIVP